MSKRRIHPEQSPRAVGPYSHAIRHGQLLYSSGQLPLDPLTGLLVPGDLEDLTHQVLRNIGTLLAHEGLDYNDVLKTTIFVVDLSQFSVINRIYGSYFQEIPPARSTVQVSALPLGSPIEIEFVAGYPERPE